MSDVWDCEMGVWRDVSEDCALAGPWPGMGGGSTWGHYWSQAATCELWAEPGSPGPGRPLYSAWLKHSYAATGAHSSVFIYLCVFQLIGFKFVYKYFLSGRFDHLRNWNWFYLLLPHKVAAKVLCDLMVVQSERYAAFNWEFLTGNIVFGHDLQVC